jgi:hypothetical protein
MISKEKRKKNISKSSKKENLESTSISFNRQIIGTIYKYIHFILVFIIGFITIFNTNINHLCILLTIISFDALSIVVLHGCPLTQLEKKYLNVSSCDESIHFLKKINILYKCNHVFERQIDLLINVWTIIALKCLIIIFFKTFNFKITNYNNLYL